MSQERGPEVCERCGILPGVQLHHLTYERIGSERPEDLQLLCKACHEFIHGKRHVDPKLDIALRRAREEKRLGDNDYFRGILAAMFLDPSSEVRKLLDERVHLTVADWTDSSPRLAEIDRRVMQVGMEQVETLRSMLRAVVEERVERGDGRSATASNTRGER